MMLDKVIFLEFCVVFVFFMIMIWKGSWCGECDDHYVMIVDLGGLGISCERLDVQRKIIWFDLGQIIDWWRSIEIVEEKQCFIA